MTKKGTDRKSDLLTEKQERTGRPPQFKVVIHNDDYTTMEFVLEVLESVFHLSPAEAYSVMMKVHQEGIGVAGVYSHEIAETKASLVMDQAQEEGFPLRATVEKE
ncbi:MAG: ATP-dependent Clp protease adaptor ClpS [Acidobacteriota bacterium]|nr:ATP-dependent Clp protease adaptor ClpS [Acidobacteriota bacterium]MDH3785621.1 ATP-dependent Clp protease adaptor ClpS [Acidobacteriota bacterium]